MEEQNNNLEQNTVEDQSSPKKLLNMEKFILPGAIVFAAILISGSVILSNGGLRLPILGKASVGDSVKQKAVSTDDDSSLGDEDAPVVVIEFSDYQCPFCRSFWRDTLPLIKSEYVDTGKVRFVYRDFPLSFHVGALPAAQASECADDQGKFWEMHDKIFSEQEKLGGGTVQFDSGDLKNWAKQIGLNAATFNSCLDSQKYASEVNADFNAGSSAGVSGTPAFFINGKSVVGAQPFSVFKNIIDTELK